MFGKKKSSKETFLEEESAEEKSPVVNKHKTEIHLSGMQIALSIVFLLLGALLIFVPAVTPLILCYALAGSIIGIGVILIVRYFLTESYKNVQRFGFSIGVLLILCGAIILVRSAVLSSYLLLFLGGLMLVASVFELQNALDLKAIADAYWWIWLLVAGVFSILAVVILVNPGANPEEMELFASVAVFTDGIVSLIGTLYLSFRLRSWQAASSLSEEPGSDQNAVGDRSSETTDDIENNTEESAGMHTPGIQEDFDAGIDE